MDEYELFAGYGEGHEDCDYHCLTCYPPCSSCGARQYEHHGDGCPLAASTIEA